MLRRALPWMAALTLSPAAPAQEPDLGRLLYENHCTECHESTVHVREHTKVKSLADLDAFVRRWSDYRKLGWGDAEVGAVREYLNLTFYGFFDDTVPPPP
jgi:mono/diheme cytochrome c family protein